MLDFGGRLQSLALLEEQVEAHPETSVLRLESNSLRRVPECVSRLVELRALLLHDNRIRETPQWLSGLSQLRILDMHGNAGLVFTALPPGLRRLNLAHTAMLEIPRAITRVQELEYLNLSGNLFAVRGSRLLEATDEASVREMLARLPLATPWGRFATSNCCDFPKHVRQEIRSTLLVFLVRLRFPRDVVIECLVPYIATSRFTWG